MGKPNLVIDEVQGKVFLDEEVIGLIRNDEKPYSIYVDFIDNYSNLNLETLTKFGIYDVGISCVKKFSDVIWIVEPSYIGFDSDGGYINLSMDIEKWNMASRVKNFIRKLENAFSNHKYLVDFEYNFFDLHCNVSFNFLLHEELDVSHDIKTIFYRVLDIFKIGFAKVLSELSFNDNIISIPFTFPPEIQSSCEQYLIYFATFLKDIGINAETTIESKTHETLFTVTPESGEEALDKIKEALQMYLSLPESPEFESVVSEFTDVGVQQLASQVYFLKSQLLMANSAIQMKDATIKSLNMTNYQQSVLIDSHQTKEKNEEEIAGGLVKVNEIKVTGFTLNLPELLRRIKRKFK